MIRLYSSCFLLSICLKMQLFAGSVRLVNDSSYPLIAQIYAADGTYLGDEKVSKRQTTQWNSSDKKQNFTDSQTPYTVKWMCLQGKEFSICRQVSTGATVTAMGGTGSYTCQAALLPQDPPPHPVGPPHGLLD
ncbi:MAG: hypothetical protein QRY72_04800 [Candidatus Rhabdochlamydia sp.]